jgi:putative spermidine/putrescine transport system permease protein
MRPSRLAAWALLAPALLVVTAGLVAPMVWLLHFSLLQSDTGMVVGPALSLDNYRRLLAATEYRPVFATTLRVACQVTLIATLLGYPMALWMLKAPGRLARWLTLIVLSPLMVSIVVTSYGWLVLLGNQGAINKLLLWSGLIDQPVKLLYTEFAITLGLTYIVLPFMTLSLLSALEKIDTRVDEAAAVLGASPWRAFWHVTAPLSLPGWVSGAILAFTISMSAYVTPAVLGPSGPQFVATAIFNLFVTLFDWGLGAAMAVVLLAFGLALVFGFLKLVERLGGVAVTGTARG